MRLLLIRHAQTPDNVEGNIGTVIPGPGLTALGHEQAGAIPAAIEGEDIQAIYVSTMVRTALTAAPLAAARGLEARVIEGIQEIGAGDFEGRSDRESIHAYMGTIISWWQDSSARIPGSENGNEFFARFTEAVARIADSHDGTVVIVSHGASLRTWASATSRNIDAEFSRTHDLPQHGDDRARGVAGGGLGRDALGRRARGRRPTRRPDGDRPHRSGGLTRPVRVSRRAQIS
ncbi:MAG: histidine phosphatase family protein [Galbitalea sp.]